MAIYARISTSDKDQNVETQLMPLRDFIAAQGWEVYKTYVDMAPANDLAHRTAWLQLLDDAAKMMRPSGGSPLSWSSSWTGPLEA